MNAKHFHRRHLRQTFVAVVLLASASLPACSRTSSSTDATPAPAPSGSARSNPAVAPAGPNELALVAPLVVGGSLDGCEVTEIQAIHRGVLNVVCRWERSTMRLWIALASDKGPEPPAKADKYAVFYSASGIEPAEAERLSKALADIVAKHADVPVPKGMTEFVPAAIPL